MAIFSQLFGKQFIEADVVPSSSIKEEAFHAKAAAFAIGVSYISNIISKCEIKHYKKNEEGKIQEVKDKLYYYLNVSPNPNQNATKLKSDLIFKLFYENNALMFLHGDGIYLADSFTREKNPLGKDVFANITIENSSVNFNRSADNVWFFEMDNQELARLVQKMLSEYSELFGYAKTACGDAVSEKWSLTTGKIPTGDKDFEEKSRDRNRKNLESFLKNPKAVFNKNTGQDITLLNKGNGNVDVTAIQNIRKEMFEIVAQALKMPVSIFYGNMTNTKDVLNAWASCEIDSLCKMLGEEFTRKSVDYKDYISGEELKVDTTALFHMDWFDMCEKGDKAIGSGLFNVDEIRNKMGEEPLNTEFSRQHWMTKNYAKIKDVMNSTNNA